MDDAQDDDAGVMQADDAGDNDAQENGEADDGSDESRLVCPLENWVPLMFPTQTS